ADPHMPPKKQLSTNQIALLRDWLAKGAEWQNIEPPPVKLSTLPSNYQPSFALAMTSNKVAVARGGAIQVYAIESNRLDLLKEFSAHKDAVQALAFSANGDWLASGAFAKTVIWETGFEITNK